MTRRARLLTLLVAVACATGLIVGPLGPPASSSPDGMRLGARVEPRAGEDPRAAVARFEQSAGRDLDVVREFLVWDSPFPDAFHTWLKDSGRTMILSVKSRRSNGTNVRWHDLATAQPGSALHAEMVRWADRLRSYEVPVYFAFNHEPESKASAAFGEAPDFIAAWRALHDVFVARGATNVSFMWIMTDYSFFVGSAAPNDASKWYPGDAYLDAMGADAYNWYTCRNGINTPWWSLERIIEPFRDFGARHPGKELWLSEFASTEDPAQPGRKAQWLRDAQALFKRPDYAQFAGVVYFNFRALDQCRWYVDSSTSALTAFQTLAQDPFYGGSAPPPPPPTSDITLVGSAGTNGNRTSHSVVVPDAVRAGDTLLLFFTSGDSVGTTTPPAGWTALDATGTDGVRGRLWTRTATAADAGSSVTVSGSVYAKADLKVVAYRGTASAPIDAHAVALDTVTRTQHTAPAVTPTAAADRVVVYWGDKSSTNTDHAIPPTLTKVEATTRGTGSGYITATVADLTAGAAGTPVGPFVATGTGAANRAVMFTVALRD